MKNRDGAWHKNFDILLQKYHMKYIWC